jgi:hypothetical protein
MPSDPDARQDIVGVLAAVDPEDKSELTPSSASR